MPQKKRSVCLKTVIEWSTKGIRPEGGRKNILRNYEQGIS